jgi:hypothetical protein
LSINMGMTRAGSWIKITSIDRVIRSSVKSKRL